MRVNQMIESFPVILLKDHTVDAYSIPCSILENPVVSVPDTHYEIHQFRRHDRAIIHHQTERTYYLDGKAVCKNRHKRFEQKDDSLEEFAAVHPDLVSKLTIKNPDGITMTRAVFYRVRSSSMKENNMC